MQWSTNLAWLAVLCATATATFGATLALQTSDYSIDSGSVDQAREAREAVIKKTTTQLPVNSDAPSCVSGHWVRNSTTYIPTTAGGMKSKLVQNTTITKHVCPNDTQIIDGPCNAAGLKTRQVMNMMPNESCQCAYVVIQTFPVECATCKLRNVSEPERCDLRADGSEVAISRQVTVRKETRASDLPVCVTNTRLTRTTPTCQESVEVENSSCVFDPKYGYSIQTLSYKFATIDRCACVTSIMNQLCACACPEPKLTESCTSVGKVKVKTSYALVNCTCVRSVETKTEYPLTCPASKTTIGACVGCMINETTVTYAWNTVKCSCEPSVQSISYPCCADRCPKSTLTNTCSEGILKNQTVSYYPARSKCATNTTTIYTPVVCPGPQYKYVNGSKVTFTATLSAPNEQCQCSQKTLSFYQPLCAPPYNVTFSACKEDGTIKQTQSFYFWQFSSCRDASTYDSLPDAKCMMENSEQNVCAGSQNVTSVTSIRLNPQRPDQRIKVVSIQREPIVCPPPQVTYGACDILSGARNITTVVYATKSHSSPCSCQPTQLRTTESCFKKRSELRDKCDPIASNPTFGELYNFLTLEPTVDGDKWSVTEVETIVPSIVCPKFERIVGACDAATCTRTVTFMKYRKTKCSCVPEGQLETAKERCCEFTDYAALKDSINWTTQVVVAYKNISSWRGTTAIAKLSWANCSLENQKAKWYNSLVHFESFRFLCRFNQTTFGECLPYGNGSASYYQSVVTNKWNYDAVSLGCLPETVKASKVLCGCNSSFLIQECYESKQLAVYQHVYVPDASSNQCILRKNLQNFQTIQCNTDATSTYATCSSNYQMVTYSQQEQLNCSCKQTSKTVNETCTIPMPSFCPIHTRIEPGSCNSGQRVIRKITYQVDNNRSVCIKSESGTKISCAECPDVYQSIDPECSKIITIDGQKRLVRYVEVTYFENMANASNASFAANVTASDKASAEQVVLHKPVCCEPVTIRSWQLCDDKKCGAPQVTFGDCYDGYMFSYTLYYVLSYMNECVQHMYVEKQTCDSSAVVLDSKIPARCMQPLAIGVCKKSLARFYYNQLRKKCDLFYYSGCAGNLNQFDSLEECETVCMTVRGDV